METQPMPLDALSEAASGLDDFRVSAPSEVLAYLRNLCDGNVILTLVAPDGRHGATTVWAVSGERGTLSFSVDAADPVFEHILKAGSAIAVGYLDSIKVQFDVAGLVPLRQAGRLSALGADIPPVLYRIQRRNAYRVKPLPRTAPIAHMRHPDARHVPLEMRVLDLSIGGCSLVAPPNSPRLETGMVLENVHIDLDGHNTMRCSLRLCHVVRLADFQGDAADSECSLRVGCEILDLTQDNERELQRFIDQTQRRRHMTAF